MVNGQLWQPRRDRPQSIHRPRRRLKCFKRDGTKGGETDGRTDGRREGRSAEVRKVEKGEREERLVVVRPTNNVLSRVLLVGARFGDQ